MDGGLSCPLCESFEVVQQPQDGVSPWPGYTCQECGAALRSPGTGKNYAAVLVVCAELLVLFSMPLLETDISDGLMDVVYWLVAAAGVALYCIRQLLHPTPRPPVQKR